MGMFAPGEVTGLLRAWRCGEQSALNQLTTVLYTELRRLAQRHMRGQPPGISVQTTMLVNEAYLRLAEASEISCHDRVHFLALCAQLMRRILVDMARSRSSLKRGGGAIPVPIDTRLANGDGLLSSGDSASPDAGYDRLWALALLERSLATLRREYAGTGREAEFDLLKEYLSVGRGEIPYAGVAERLGVGASAARVSVHRLRKRFREAFRAEVAATVADPSEIEDELRQLRAALAS